MYSQKIIYVYKPVVVVGIGGNVTPLDKQLK
jgi:hypothetical protein